MLCLVWTNRCIWIAGACVVKFQGCSGFCGGTPWCWLIKTNVTENGIQIHKYCDGRIDRVSKWWLLGAFSWWKYFVTTCDKYLEITSRRHSGFHAQFWYSGMMQKSNTCGFFGWQYFGTEFLKWFVLLGSWHPKWQAFKYICDYKLCYCEIMYMNPYPSICNKDRNPECLFYAIWFQSN